MHIFWQRRIDTVTPSPDHPVTPSPYWYPFKTDNGAIREDRIVFPIPPGVHWKDVQAVPLPKKELSVVSGPLSVVEKKTRKNNGQRTTDHGRDGMVGILVGGRIKYVPKPGYVSPSGACPERSRRACPERSRRAKREPKAKAPAERIDPKYLAAAREFRDRYLERVNGSPESLLAPAGKYDVCRALPAPAVGATAAMGIEAPARHALPSAA